MGDKMKYIYIILSIVFSFLGREATKFELIYSGNLDSNKIYLTFDDGYSAKNTESILNTLKKYNVPATFFMEGDFLVKNPALIKRIANEQTLANHTMCHCDITKLSNDDLKKDILEFEQKALEITGKEITKYFRPPMGYINEEKGQLIADLGYKIFMWNVKIYDYKNYDDLGFDYAYSNIVKQVKNGSIILMHTLTKSNADALPKIIDTLRGKGFEFAPLSEI